MALKPLLLGTIGCLQETKVRLGQLVDLCISTVRCVVLILKLKALLHGTIDLLLRINAEAESADHLKQGYMFRLWAVRCLPVRPKLCSSLLRPLLLDLELRQSRLIS